MATILSAFSIFCIFFLFHLSFSKMMCVLWIIYDFSYNVHYNGNTYTPRYRKRMYYNMMMTFVIRRIIISNKIFHLSLGYYGHVILTIYKTTKIVWNTWKFGWKIAIQFLDYKRNERWNKNVILFCMFVRLWTIRFCKIVFRTVKRFSPLGTRKLCIIVIIIIYWTKYASLLDFV